MESSWIVIIFTILFLSEIKAVKLFDTLYHPAGHRLSLYPQDCTGHCHDGVAVDFAFRAQKECPEELSWYKDVEAFNHAKCFNETKRICSYCIMRKPRGMFLTNDCIYDPPKTGCQRATQDLHRGICSHCDKLKNYKYPEEL